MSLLGGSVQFNGAASSVASTVTGGPRGRLLLADAEVMRVRDLGSAEARFTVRTKPEILARLQSVAKSAKGEEKREEEEA